MGTVDDTELGASADPRLREMLAAADRGERAPAANDAAAVTAPGAPPIEESQHWIDAVLRYGRMARRLLPEHVRVEWTDENLREVGVELAACAKHYGWQWGRKLTHPLARLGAATLPLAWPIAAPYVIAQVGALLGGPPPAASPETARGSVPAPSPEAAAAATAETGEPAGRPFPDLTDHGPGPRPAA